MHESTVAASLLRIIEDEIIKYDTETVRRVTSVVLQVGVLAGIEKQTLTACFEMLAEDTLAKGARLEVKTVPMQGTCSNCNQQVTTLERSFTCPLCKTNTVEWAGGNEMFISALKVAEEA